MKLYVAVSSPECREKYGTVQIFGHDNNNSNFIPDKINRRLNSINPEAFVFPSA
jgi:hypothetical protein